MKNPKREARNLKQISSTNNRNSKQCFKLGVLDLAVVSDFVPDWIGDRISDFRRRGFTIIELLVVIAIIGMIGSLVFIQFAGVRARGRDAQREQSIKTIQSALTLYATNNRIFPIYSGPITGADPLSVALVAADAIPAMPKDPLDAGAYAFAYDSSGGQTYVLTYALETDSIPGKAKGSQSVSP